MTEKGVFMAATLVDWKYPEVFEDTWKQMKKLYGKKLGSKNARKNQLNTFVVTELELKKSPDRKARVETEDGILQLLKEYADEINDLHNKEYKKQGDISQIYREGFSSQNRLDLYDQYIDQKNSVFQKIEGEIENSALKGSVLIWDMPGFEGDKLILPECVATFTSYPEGSDELIDSIDEVLIANFARRYLPFSNELIGDAVTSFNHLESIVGKFKDDSRIPDGLKISLQTFIGVISGIQEVLKLFKREVAKVYDIAIDSFGYLQSLPSDEMKEWATIKNPKLGEEIIALIDEKMETIVSIKPKLRGLLTGTTDLPKDVTHELMESMVETDITSGGLLMWVHRFQQLPSFTTLETGIAYEEFEGETYWPKVADGLIEAQVLFKTFTRGSSYIYALRGVDVEIKEGEFVVVRGPSGAGKTTLLNILAGLDTPGRGGVFFKGEDIVNMKDRKRSKLRRENFAFIFQSYALIPHLTAYENTKLPLDLSGLSKDLAEGIQKILDDVGIGEYADHKPALLSGGQMQRLGIARALANQPKILFADEPTGDLDEATGMVVMELLKKYHEETGMTIVLVTHDPNVAKFATREIFLMDGQVVDSLPE
ncbi:MAG: ABC transporter ATP-binding protein [Candidatus Kariarchaeaceae archaeon]|jgi:ABC-type lipoprotein export system ATPase subunit